MTLLSSLIEVRGIALLSCDISDKENVSFLNLFGLFIYIIAMQVWTFDKYIAKYEFVIKKLLNLFFYNPLFSVMTNTLWK